MRTEGNGSRIQSFGRYSRFSVTKAAFRVQTPKQRGSSGSCLVPLAFGCRQPPYRRDSRLFCTQLSPWTPVPFLSKPCARFSDPPRAAAEPRLPRPPLPLRACAVGRSHGNGRALRLPVAVKITLCATPVAVTLRAQADLPQLAVLALTPRRRNERRRAAAPAPPAPGRPRRPRPLPPPRPLRLLSPWVERAPPMRWRGVEGSAAGIGQGGGAGRCRPEESGIAAGSG